MQFFTWEYWFGWPAFIGTAMLTTLLVVFGVLFVGGTILAFTYHFIEDRWLRQVARRAASMAALLGGIGLLLVCARVQRIPIFMYRYWLLFWGVGAGVWLWRLARYAERRREALEEENRRYAMRDRFLKK